MLKSTSIILLLFASLCTGAQEVFRLDFEERFLPDDWSAGEYTEWGRVLGDGGGAFFRFHPVSWMDELQSPELELEAGIYVLYYSWNEAASGTPDYCDIRIRSESGPWDELDRIGEGNGRTWQRDSTVLGLLENGSYQLEFSYRSTVRFPSQYLNLDNIYLVRRDIATGLPGEEERSIAVFPNPADGYAGVRLKNGDAEIASPLELFNNAGRSVDVDWIRTGEQQWSAATGHLPAGIYFIRWTGGSTAAWSRLVIQR